MPFFCVFLCLCFFSICQMFLFIGSCVVYLPPCCLLASLWEGAFFARRAALLVAVHDDGTCRFTGRAQKV